jgi:hypothetical protein
MGTVLARFRRRGVAAGVGVVCVLAVAVLLLPVEGISREWSGRSGVEHIDAGILRYARVEGTFGAEGVRVEWHVAWGRLAITWGLVQGCWGGVIGAWWWGRFRERRA